MIFNICIARKTHVLGLAFRQFCQTMIAIQNESISSCLFHSYLFLRSFLFPPGRVPFMCQHNTQHLFSDRMGESEKKDFFSFVLGWKTNYY